MQKYAYFGEFSIFPFKIIFLFGNVFSFDFTGGQHISLILVKSGKKLRIRTSAIHLRTVLNEQNFDREINPLAYRFEVIVSSFPLP